MTTDSAIWGFLGAALALGLRELGGFVMKTKLERHRATIDRLLNGKLWIVLAGLISIALIVAFAFAIFGNEQPATKKDVLLGVSMALLLIVLFVNLGDDVIRWGKRYRELADAEDLKKLAPAQPPARRGQRSRL